MARPNKVKAYPVNDYFVLTRQADGTISEASVVTSGTNEADVAEAGSGDNPVGVVEGKTVGDSNDYDDGEKVNLVVDGVVRVEANGSVTEGDVVKAGAGGTVVPVTGDGTDSPSLHVGKALESGADGDVIEVAL